MICARGTRNKLKSIRQKRGFDQRTTDAKTHSVGDYIWVFQEVALPKGTKKLLKNGVVSLN